MTDTYSRDRANAALLFGYLSEAGVTPLEAAALTPADLVTRTRALHLSVTDLVAAWPATLEMLAGNPVPDYDFTQPDDPFDGLNGGPITQGPRAGDVVELADGRRGVIDGGDHYGPGFLMVVLGASAHRSPTSGHVSVSGGPCPCVPVDTVERSGTVVQRFWRWKDRPRAGGGIEYNARVTLWKVVR